jgi:Reverse transcriptase (RNA-dependent DNA polymerase)
MFIQRKEEKIFIWVMYVDDIILTGNDHVQMKKFKDNLANEFKIKDLDELH